MDPVLTHIATAVVTALVIIGAYWLFKQKTKVEPAEEETLEYLAVKEFQILQALILKKQQAIATAQADLTASQARFTAAKTSIAAMQ